MLKLLDIIKHITILNNVLLVLRPTDNTDENPD